MDRACYRGTAHARGEGHTLRDHAGPRTLVCELYPGILVAEKYGICTVLTYGNLVELLPPRSDDRLGMTSGQAVFAALQFGRQMSSSTRTWSPPQWVRGRT